ncbi:MAG: calcineurin-like phosphoesterase C-terminal domain-containing protein [Alistipes sp.]|nr:calcineurin-like phosphoesterase C-terminal domain-containing protein [Alistipes sp.]
MKKFLSLVALLAVVLTANAAYPDKIKRIKAPKSATLVGVVYCGDLPMSGVVVSDGEQTTITDAQGIYRLKSKKPCSTVFISTPYGFRAVSNGDVRLNYWRHVQYEPKVQERHDFELERVSDSKFSLLMLSDTHFCNNPKIEDLRHFEQLVMPAVKSAAEESGDIPSYAFILGDITWDRFWYETGFDIERVPSYLKEQGFPMPVFGVMGNHDNDPSTIPDAAADFNGAKRYRKVFGPTYYSMNVGRTHIVVLDNIVYKNEVKPNQKQHEGVVGSRNYDLCIDDVQLAWLERDLSYITNKTTPIIVCMHAPLHTYDGEGRVISGLTKGSDKRLVELLKDFKQVRIFSGHSHRTSSFVHEQYPNIVEYNITSVGGDLWKTPNKCGMNIGEDGGAAGFRKVVFDGDKCLNLWCNTEVVGGSNIPFRAYDMNVVSGIYKDDELLQKLCTLQRKQKDYSDAAYADYVYVNCWAWEQGCSLTISENGTPLTVERVKDSDPLAAKVVFAPAAKTTKKESSKTNRLSVSANMFRAKCTTSDATLTITFSTPSGEMFTQELVRPVAFPVE